MSSCCALKRLVAFWLFAGIAAGVSAQNVYSPQGGEYAIAGSLPGDQVFPQVALGSAGGILVWQDNVTDGDGLGISARRLAANLSGAFGVFRVNQQAAGDQENVRVAMLKDGGTAFVWQGGASGFQHIYARFLKSDGTFATGDVVVNTYTNNHQINPSVTVLNGGNVVVTWSSYGQDGDMYGVYGQRFSPSGERIGGEFQLNQAFTLNQRSPTLAPLADGGFVAAWISEKPLGVDTNGVVRYSAVCAGRLFDGEGNPRADELQLNTGTGLCANPVLCASSQGGFAMAWSRKQPLGLASSVVIGTSWDVYARCFDSAGNPVGESVLVNTTTYGDQFAPKIACSGSDYLVVWTSLGQDGSREGVYGQFLTASGQLAGGEFRVTTTTVSQQMHPMVASDGAGRFLAVWTSFVGGPASFDVLAQRYAVSQVLPAPEAPFVYVPFEVDSGGVYVPRLQLSWQEVSGLSVAAYEIYRDGASEPSGATSSNAWVVSGLQPGSTHSFRIDYLTSDGRHSPLSPSATGTTWSGANFGGLPFEWMTAQFGPDVLSWPKPTDDSDGDGASNRQEFLAGTIPTDPASVMNVRLVATAQGSQLSWNCRPGFLYQVQVSEDLSAGSWTNHGSPRFAAGTSDSVLVTGVGSAAYYRIVMLR